MSINELINIVNKQDGKLINLSEDAFTESTFQCSKGHQFKAYNNDVINGKWCDNCESKDKLDMVLDKLNIKYEKDILLDGCAFYRKIEGNRRFLLSLSEKDEKQKKEINVAEKNNFNILFLLDDDNLEERLWNILKENKTVNYLQKKITREHQCAIEEELGDKKGDATSVVKRTTQVDARDRHYAYGYIRVSTIMQVNDGFSLDAQESKISTEANKHNLFLKSLYIDRGLSGGSMDKRLALKSMRAVINKDDWIIIASISRLARNTKELLELVEEIEKKGAHLLIIDLNLDITSPSGKLILTMMAGQAQFERELTSERVKGVLDHLRKTGNLRTKPNFGWKLNPDRSPGAALHIRDEKEQRIIERIRYYRGLHKDMGITAFTRFINNVGVPCPRNSKQWYHGTVGKIMEREGIK